MQQDLRGNPVSSRSAAALAAAELALWRMMSFYDVPVADLEAAQAADPGWMLAPLMQAGFLLSLTEPALHGQAATLLDRAAALARAGNDRERAHLAALRRLQAGDWAGACEAWEALLLLHPRDALALQWAHLFDFHRGDASNLRLRVARVLPEWPVDDPLRPYVLGLYSFGLEENQLYGEAEAAGLAALGGPAKVPWAIHAVAHVMEMQGRHAEGAAWMRQWHADWAEGNGFVGHLGFHAGLFALEGLDTADALRLCDAHLRAEPAQITLQRLDAAALLWRLQLLGADVGPRWHALLAHWDLSDAAAGYSAFNDLHALLALLGAREPARARDWVLRVGRGAQARGGAAAHVARDLGTPLMLGLLAFAERHFDDAIAALYPVRSRANAFGGSHAQRDLITQTLLAAAAGARDKAVGRALLNERRLAKAVTPLTIHWAERLR